MRIISQDEKLDIPYGKSIICNEGRIIKCALLMSGGSFENFAIYSTPEIAQNVMQNLHKQCAAGSKIFRFPREGEHCMLLWNADEE